MEITNETFGRITELAKLSFYRQELIILAALTVFIFLVRLPSLDQPWDNDGGAIAYNSRLIVAGEPLYSTHHPGHHLPAAYYIYALAFKLFGDSMGAIKLFLMLWFVPAAYLHYRLGLLLADKTTGLLGALLFVLLTSELWLKGNTTEIELFANLPRIAVIWLLVSLLRRNTHGWPFGIIGLLGAFCFWFKAVYFSPLGVTGIILVLNLWQERQVKSFVSSLLWLLLGLFIGLMLPLVYFGSLGLIGRLWLVFVFGSSHVSSALGPAFIILYPLLGLSLANASFLMLGLAGTLLILFNKKLPWAEKLVVPIWLALTFIEAGLSRKPWPNYYLLLIPPLAFSAAWLLTQLFGASRNLTRPALRWTLGGIVAFMLISIPVMTGWRNFTYYQHYLYYLSGQETYREFIAKALGQHGKELMAIQDTAAYIQTQSVPDDRIYLWGDYPQLYYMANRRCALDAIWNIYTEIPYLPGGIDEARQQILAPTTLYIIVMDPPPAWLATALDNSYRLVQTFDVVEIYQRSDRIGPIPHQNTPGLKPQPIK